MKKTNKLLIYTIIISLISTSVFAQDCFVCGGTYFPTGVATLVRNLYNLIKLLVPVVIIIVGMVDLLRAVMASDEKKMEESKSRLIKKLIAGVTIFLLFAIVQFVFKNLLGHNGALSSSMFDCVTYFISEEPVSATCPTREDSIKDWINEHKYDSYKAPSASSSDDCSKRSKNERYCTNMSGCKWDSTNKKCYKYTASSANSDDDCSKRSANERYCTNMSGCKWDGKKCLKK